MQIICSFLFVGLVETNWCMQQRLAIHNSNALQTITLSKPEFKEAFIQNKNEIKYKNHYYDIHSVFQMNDTVVVKVLADLKETSWQHVAKKQSDHANQKLSFYKVLSEYIGTDGQGIDNITNQLVIKMHQLERDIFWDKTHCINISTPPPDYC